ncbi:MAG TPA: hypothetical protein DD706_19185 [Nitrospiraceae bacterium]|nr:hypothetical protein [Nitrospiraceae bacterium]
MELLGSQKGEGLSFTYVKHTEQKLGMFIWKIFLIHVSDLRHMAKFRIISFNPTLKQTLVFAVTILASIL